MIKKARKGNFVMKKRNFVVLLIIIATILTMACSCEIKSEGADISQSDKKTTSEDLYLNIDDTFDTDMLFCAIASDWSDEKKSLTEYYKTNNLGLLEVNDVDNQIVFLKIKLEDILKNREFEFAKDSMTRISMDDISEGDLLYIHKKKNADSNIDGKIDAIIKVEQDEKRILAEGENGIFYGLEPYVDAKIEDDNFVIITKDEDQWMYFDDSCLNCKANGVYFNEVYGLAKGATFEYILDPKNLKNLKMIKFNEISKVEAMADYMIKAELKQVEDTETGFYITYDLGDAIDKVVKTYSEIDEKMIDYIKNEKWDDKDTAILGINHLNQLVFIQKLDDENIKAQHLESVKVLYEYIYERNGNLMEVVIEDSEGRERRLWYTKEDKEKIFGQDLDGSIVDIDVIASGYITNIKPVITSDLNSEKYTILAVAKNEIELGYGNVNRISPNEFDEKNRAWMKLSDDCKWFIEDLDDDCIGKEAYVQLDEDDKIKIVYVQPRLYGVGNAGSKPSHEEDRKTALKLIQLSDWGHDFCEMDAIVGEEHPKTMVKVTEETKGYEYNYDFNSSQEDSSELKDIYSNSLEGLKKMDIADKRFRKNEIYLASFDTNLNYEVKDMIQIVPNENSIFDGKLYNDRFITKDGNVIALDGNVTIVYDNDAMKKEYFLEEFDPNITGAVLMIGESENIEYIFLIGEEPKVLYR